METATTTPGQDAGLGSELKQDAQKLTEAAGERLSSEADARKGEVAAQARSVSDALQSAAGELAGADTPDWLRSAFEQGAQTLQRLADGVERKNARELLGEVRDIGREHPGAFLGACALAGFAAARVFKAGAAGATGAGTGPRGASSAPARYAGPAIADPPLFFAGQDQASAANPSTGER